MECHSHFKHSYIRQETHLHKYLHVIASGIAFAITGELFFKDVPWLLRKNASRGTVYAWEMFTIYGETGKRCHLALC